MYRNAYAISTKKLMALALVLVFLLSAFSFMRISLAAPITAQIETSPYWDVLASDTSTVTNGQIEVEPGKTLVFGIRSLSGSGTFNVVASGTQLSLITPTDVYYQYAVPTPTSATSFNVSVTATGKVTLPADKPGVYTITASSPTDVPFGSTLTFTVDVDNAYGSITPVMSIGGTQLARTGSQTSYSFTTTVIDGDVTVTLDNAAAYTNTTAYTVTVQQDNRYTVSFVSPTGTTTSNSTTVNNGSNCTFEIKPLPVFRGNPAPVVTANGTTLTATAINDGWRYTLPNVQADTTVNVFIDDTRDDTKWEVMPGTTKYTVTLPQGPGYSVSQVANSLYNNGALFYVAAGNSLTFFVTPQVGYDKSTLVVKANNTMLNPVNNFYTIPNIQSNVIVDITINQEGGYTQLTPLSLTDTTGRVTITGLFTGSPLLTVKDIASGSSDYNTLYASANKGVVLGAYDIGLSSATVYGSLKVRFNVGTLYNGATLWVLHYVNGSIDRHVTTVNNGAAEISVTSLSPFMVVDPSGNIITTTTTTAIGPPRTGDVISIVGVAVIVIAAGIFFSVRAYRKKQTRA